jgi:hypothetical protein
MRRFILVASLLLAFGAFPKRAAPAEAAGNDVVGQFYDVTDIVYRGLVEPRARMRLDPGISDGGGPRYYNPDEPVFHASSELAWIGDDVDRLEEIICEAAARNRERQDVTNVSFVRVGARLKAYVLALPDAHTFIGKVLDLLRAALCARVHVTVMEDGKLLGTASGAIGQEMSVALIANSPMMRNSEMMPGPRNNTFVDDFHGGREISLWAVKLVDDRIRVHGKFTERMLLKRRSVMTMLGELEQPEFTSVYQPFVADLVDPGVVKLAVKDHTYELRVTCGASFRNFGMQLADGSELAAYNLVGSLRRTLTTGDPFSDYVWFDLSDPYEYKYGRSSQDCGYQVATQLDDAELTKLPGTTFEQYGFMSIACFSNRDIEKTKQAQALKDWEERKQELANFPVGVPGKFRVRMWELPEGDAAADRIPAVAPAMEVQLSLFEGQAADWHDLVVMSHINEYDSSFHVWLPQVFHGFVSAGSYVLLDWKEGNVSLTLKHGTLEAELDQYDTGIRDPQPQIIERPTTTLRRLLVSAPLAPGEYALTITPSATGKVLVAALERLE